MKICLASIHPRLLSGQIDGLIALAEVLESRGHTVRVVSTFRDEQLQTAERWALTTSDSSHPIGKLVQMGAIVAKVVRVSGDCDIVHFNVPTPSFALLADAVTLLTDKPIVCGFEAHLASVPAALARLRAAPEFYAPRVVINNGLVARTTLRKSTRWIVSSEFQRRELADLGYDLGRVDVVPNLVDRKKLARLPRRVARQALNLPEERPLIVFAGHYHDVKGHDLLIEAFRRIRSRAPSARLVLAWSGIGQQTRVQRQIADAGLAEAIIELGRVPIGQLFSAADVVALPYRQTIGQAAFPGTVLEAMAVGVPLVTSTLPLLVELIEAGHTGLLSEPGDVDQLGDQIVKLLSDQSLQDRMVEAQQAAMRERFDAGRLAAAYEATYEQAVAGKARLLQAA